MTGVRRDRSRLIGLWAGIVLGIGFISGISVRQLADDSGAKADESAQDGQSAAESTDDSDDRSSALDASGAACQVVGGHGQETNEPEFVAGVEDAQLEDLVFALEIVDVRVEPVTFSDLADDPEPFRRQAVALGSELTGVMLIQGGPRQLEIAKEFKGESPGSWVIVVLPSAGETPPGDYPPGTVVFTAPAADNQAASLDPAAVALAGDVIRGKKECVRTPAPQDTDDESVNEGSQS